MIGIEGKLNRSSSELNFNMYNHHNGDMNKDDKKKRGRSPFR